MKYEEKNEAVEVPKGTGIEGFLRALREILQLPKVQEVHIDARGKVSYKYFLREGEEARALDLDLAFASLMPYAVVRNGHVIEVLPTSGHPAVLLTQLFTRAAADHVFPVAWVGGANTAVWTWFARTMGFESPVDDELYGLPFYRDRLVDDGVLILCAAFGRHSGFTDTQRSYKVLLPR